jgi:hypothetical protein
MYDINSEPKAIFITFFTLISFMIVVVYGFNSMGVFYGDRIETKTIRNFRSNPMFALTKGDLNRIQENKLKNNKLLQKLSKEITIAIGVNIVMFVLGKFSHDILNLLLY